MPPRLKINKGEKYGRLTIIKEVEKKGTNRIFECKCDCGKTKEIRIYSITGGITKSCGCLQKERHFIKHGFGGTKIYYVWNQLRQRCRNKNTSHYKNYGGRGITYDKKWETFEGFWKDMGQTYKKGLTIDRIDNNGNYNKKNCKWSTQKEQQRNRTNNRIYKGKCIAEWCEELNINRRSFYGRLERGWDMEQALFIPFKS